MSLYRFFSFYTDQTVRRPVQKRCKFLSVGRYFNLKTFVERPRTTRDLGVCMRIPVSPLDVGYNIIMSLREKISESIRFPMLETPVVRYLPNCIAEVHVCLFILFPL